MNKKLSGRTCWWNGKMIPEHEARLSIYDSSLMWGSCVFTMTRSFNKKHFRINQHINRLYNNARYIGIDIPYTKEQLLEVIEKVTKENEKLFREDDEHRLMINVTPGLLSIYENSGVDIEPGCNVIIADYPLRWTVQALGHLFDEGINAVVPAQRAIPARLLDPKVKNRSRLHYLKANQEVSRMKGKNNWGLLLDEDGFVTEGIGSNFFIVKDGVIFTPEGRNVLRGISRQTVVGLANSMVMRQEHGNMTTDIKYIQETNIEPYDIFEADEAFMTATPFCMLPVTHFEGKPIGTGTPGPIYQQILSAWSELVQVDIKKQIQDWQSDGVNPYEQK